VIKSILQSLIVAADWHELMIRQALYSHLLPT